MQTFIANYFHKYILKNMHHVNWNIDYLQNVFDMEIVTYSVCGMYKVMTCVA